MTFDEFLMVFFHLLLTTPDNFPTAAIVVG